MFEVTDVTTRFNAAEIQEIEDMISLSQSIKELEDKKKKISDSLKKRMTALSINKIEHKGASIIIVDSSRVTITKAKKDMFIAELNKMGKSGLLKVEVDINKESLEAEMDAGLIDKDFVNQYVKFTDVKTLRCTC